MTQEELLPVVEADIKPIAPVSRIDMVLQAATASDVDVDRMERLFAMAETLRKTEAEQAYNLAMQQCQAEIPPIPKRAVNQQTNSKYAKLETVLEIVTPIATSHGFALSFGTTPSPLEDHIRVSCLVSHTGGHSRTFEYDAPIDIAGIKGQVNKTRTHASGSTMSYGRRYLVGLVFNLAYFDDDDDGQRSSTSPRIHGCYVQDGSFQPPLEYAVGHLSEHIEEIVEAIRENRFEDAWALYSQLTMGQQMALKVAPSKDGPWPQDVWNSMQPRGEFREWVTEHLRQQRAEDAKAKQEGHEGDPA